MPRTTPLRFAVLALATSVVLTAARPAGATCDPIFTTRIGPPSMAQPNGSFQTVSEDCTGLAGCSDFFDVELQENDQLDLTFCSDGGTASFNTDISIWKGPQFDDLEECSEATCGSLTDLTFFAPDAGTYRVRIGRVGPFPPLFPGGPYTLAYSGPIGSTIAPATCGDGALDAGEECDDGNSVGGDCCSGSCTFEGSGEICQDDGNSCTNDQCDGAGVCLHPNKAAGEFCDGDLYFCTFDECDGAGTCTHTNIPDCDMLPACGPTLPSGVATFEHPKKAKQFDSSLVQAYVGCGNINGGIPSTTTEGGIPACEPETPNERDGSPSDGWHWDSSKAQGRVKIYTRCTGAADFGVKLTMSGITDGNGDPANGPGTFAMMVALTLVEPDNDTMTTISFPMEFAFDAIDGRVKVQTSGNAMLSEASLPPFPNGTSVSLRGVDPFDGGLLEIRDPNGNPFARPGVFLPDLPQ